ncbi:glycosyltransferase family 2 protein [Clostridium estertheticum]|uniref:glycosyltransferase family 2 protein n=1 Tax=Clostridium estertheticum TaxID=238834 RepID=UPI0009FE4B2D|nr:glycosyltransferase family 2 protein [Clostridium estertheticum]MBU3172015.1 glycosyltransferase family 2 protein [Clostridium estertheticum]MBZ9614129.1 glycosyltransferase family 2 protein [Clostridium estertheticum subsp. laramiense]WAG74078.1 glycosyltransferase family 2 protein [Clostridium estertheticum]
MSNGIIYSVIVPLYNEEIVIEESYKRLKSVMDSTKGKYEILFVNDGSRDATRNKTENICRADKNIKLINFSRNFGHQAAITAGMNQAIGDAVIVIDADLQDPPESIIDMISKWKEGYDVVYGKRVKRVGETFFKKFTSTAYYRLLKSMTSIDIPVDTGDFRLIDRKVCDALNSMPEKNRYIRGLVSWIGYKQTFVEFVRKERFAGETKYSLKKMFTLAFDGITSFSYKPLIFAGYFGAFTGLIGTILLIDTIVTSMINENAILNLGLILSISLMMFGLMFCFMAIMGQYIARISEESKNRPLYIVANTVSYNELKNSVTFKGNRSPEIYDLKITSKGESIGN